MKAENMHIDIKIYRKKISENIFIFCSIYVNIKYIFNLNTTTEASNAYISDLIGLIYKF